MATNLPPNTEMADASKTKLVFDNYGKKQAEYRAVDVDATLAFFKSRGFSDEATHSVTSILLKQAKVEKVAIMSILDSIKKTSDAQLSAFVSEVMNNDRVPTSTLGVRTEVKKNIQTRNILE